jgi:hypothetical protein
MVIVYYEKQVAAVGVVSVRYINMPKSGKEIP